MNVAMILNIIVISILPFRETMVQTNYVLPNVLAFLLSLLSVASSKLHSSATFTFFLTTVRHVDRSSVLHSKSLILILTAFKSLWQTSLNRRRGRLVFLYSDASSPYRRSLGMRPGFILLTCPSHLKHLSLRII